MSTTEPTQTYGYGTADERLKAMRNMDTEGLIQFLELAPALQQSIIRHIYRRLQRESRTNPSGRVMEALKEAAGRLS